MTQTQLDEIRARWEWAMDTAPARLVTDPDLIITNSLKDIPALLAHVERLQRKLDKARRRDESYTDFLHELERLRP